MPTPATRSPWRAGAALLVPEAPLALATVLLVRLPALHHALDAAARVYPAVAFGLGAYLALRYRRGRLWFFIVTLALAAWGPAWAASPAARRLAGDAVAFLLPLDLLAFSLLADRGIFTRAGFTRWGVLALEVVAVALGVTHFQRTAAGVARADLLAAPLIAWTHLAAPAILAFILAAALLAVLAAREPRSPGRGALWALALCLFAFVAARPGAAAVVTFSSAAAVLSLGVIETVHRQVYQDALTGLPGRRALDEALERISGHFTVAMVDVDHFKRFNDTFGHDVGDDVLRLVAARLGQVDGGGRAFRYGGEEFAILFESRSVEDALPALDAVREAVEASGFTVRRRLRPRNKPAAPRASRERPRAQVTISIGVAAMGGRMKRAEQVLEAADRALYRAKERGRNRVETA